MTSNAGNGVFLCRRIFIFWVILCETRRVRRIYNVLWGSICINITFTPYLLHISSLFSNNRSLNFRSAAMLVAMTTTLLTQLCWQNKCWNLQCFHRFFVFVLLCTRESDSFSGIKCFISGLQSVHGRIYLSPRWINIPITTSGALRPLSLLECLFISGLVYKPVDELQPRYKT